VNLAKLKSCVGATVGLRPKAGRRAEAGHLEEIDDDWLIESVDRSAGIRIKNLRTGHCVSLNQDHVHHFQSAPPAPNQSKKGWIEITVRLELKGDEVIIEPILSGPGRLPRITVSKDPPQQSPSRDGDIWIQYKE
jgi:hypothetical protein